MELITGWVLKLYFLGSSLGSAAWFWAVHVDLITSVHSCKMGISTCFIELMVRLNNTYKMLRIEKHGRSDSSRCG